MAHHALPENLAHARADGGLLLARVSAIAWPSHDWGDTVARLYVGNLSYNTSEEHLKAAFSCYGNVAELTVIRDPDSKLSKGFGFVDMPEPGEAAAAVEGLHGALLDGRSLIVQRVLR